MTHLWRRGLGIAAGVAAAGSLAACESPAPPAPARPAGPWTTRLVLRQANVVAGPPIKAVLIITYRGRAPVNLQHRCGPQLGVALTNRRFPPAAAFPAICRVGPFIIKPGVTRRALTVPTTYSGCSQVAGAGNSQDPACLPGRRAVPPLPPGSYRAVLVSYEFAVPAPAPVLVTLRAGR